MEVYIMKTLISAVVVAAALVAPVASFAQSNQPVTRAQVRAELVQLEKAGYNPVSDQTAYPANIQAAQARVDAQNGTAQAANSGYGAPIAGSSQAGRAVSGTDRNSTYFGN
jgi:outer membrane murein-binding lipoprotein Lpp